MKTIGVLGGTFDPVHFGHLRLALEIRDQLSLSNVFMMPAATPPLRDKPHASAPVRVQMLEMAIADEKGLYCDDRELRRKGKSFTVDTLKSLREEFPQDSICLILGMDAFARLEQWNRWRELFELAHICVAKRPGVRQAFEGELNKIVKQRQIDDVSALCESTAGNVCIRDIPALDVSATRIRELVASGRNPRFLLPDAVLNIINQRGLYRDAQ